MLERSRGGFIQGGGFTEVSRGVIEIAPLEIGVATPEVGEHGIRPEDKRAAIVLNGRRGIARAQRRLALGHELTVFTLPCGRLVGHRRTDSGYCQKGHRQEGAFHTDS